MGIEHEHHRHVYGPPWSEDYVAVCKCGWRSRQHRTKMAALREYKDHRVIRIQGHNPLPGTPIGELLA